MVKRSQVPIVNRTLSWRNRSALLRAGQAFTSADRNPCALLEKYVSSLRGGQAYTCAECEPCAVLDKIGVLQRRRPKERPLP
ncbi:jg7455 [Pararge aegeria aegeria]|uniref:Jg7455 protein n=1 Tax=Pararge aegeria aegeria TaxID=348720 RepID=A0A8S4RE18_9NEOP|nr:jg7455 [Pararge aegeria aegeria]